ncbi:MAG: hypothetical protein CL687_05030 [Candidatus Pelagibacter sp.]|nr:hypothetical protein [Candidatus Pelagibacter sp.]OUW23309.1 MAG: hypothetical protein CBD34_03425 [Rickettsiales bacterium TMED174]
MNIRLYQPNSIAENTTKLLSKEHTHYVVNVMRLKRGSRINFFNEEGEWEGEIIFLNKNRVEVKFLKKIKKKIVSSKVELAICLIKKNSFETILQKATELGIKKIIPIVSERTEVKELNYDRANKIVIEATEQSNQLKPPEILEVIKLSNFLDNMDNTSQLLFADVNSMNKIKKDSLNSEKQTFILIGPEGDFSLNERELIMSKSNSIPFSLSKSILRSDTAAISAISLVNFILNDH